MFEFNPVVNIILFIGLVAVGREVYFVVLNRWPFIHHSDLHYWIWQFCWLNFISVVLIFGGNEYTIATTFANCLWASVFTAINRIRVDRRF